MPPARNRPSRRRERGLKASCLVLGSSATPILHEGRTAHLLPFKSADNRKRYAVGQRLAVKEMVPGPTACHVILFDVKGPDPLEPFYLKHVTRQVARELGHVRLDVFWRKWIVAHDQAWFVRVLGEEGEVTDDAIESRFANRWAENKLAWLLRFTVDTSASPRLLAQSGGGSSSFRTDADGRHVYSMRKEDREEDRGYTSTDSRKVAGELPALTDSEWATHVGPNSGYRAQDRLAQQRASREARSVDQRVEWAKATAKGKGYDIRDEVRRYDRHVQRGESGKALKQLALIEARVFPAVAA